MEDARKYIEYLNFISCNVYANKNTYTAYKRGEELDKAINLEELEIIEILERLGFSLDYIGTYLYKDLIIAILNQLKGIPERIKVLDEDELSRQLNNLFSQFYFDIARNDLDIGIKTFHAAIKQAVAKIDIEKDKEFCKQIFGNDYNPNNYSLNALTIAKYYFAFNVKRKDNSLKRVKNIDKKTFTVDFSANQ